MRCQGASKWGKLRTRIGGPLHLRSWYTGVGFLADNIFSRRRTDGNDFLERLVVVVTACELQRARLKDLDTLASVDFEIPALLPVLVVHTRIIRVSTRADEPHDSWKGQCDGQSVQDLHGFGYLWRYYELDGVV
jgi:hypothetical protein